MMIQLIPNAIYLYLFLFHIYGDNIVKSCNGLMKKFLKEYAPESEELSYFENLEKSKS